MVYYRVKRLRSRVMLLFSDLFLEGIKLFFPEIFLSLSILMLLLYGVFLATSRNYNYPLITRNVYFYLLIFFNHYNSVSHIHTFVHILAINFRIILSIYFSVKRISINWIIIFRFKLFNFIIFF